MVLVGGVDIGNSTTEVCIGQVDDSGKIHFCSSAMTPTTGTKGTIHNIVGIKDALTKALEKIQKDISDLDEIRLNEAAPVIGDTAMETITETIITESTMIGHNPYTPSGEGFGLGTTVCIKDLFNVEPGKDYIVVIPRVVTYEEAAFLINEASKRINIQGAILEADEAVLVNNRLNRKIPIVDEVKLIEKVPLGVEAVVEVAGQGKTIRYLSNPYEIATLFNLDAEETKYVVPVAKSLIGNRSAVVIRTPKGQVEERIIKAGALEIITPNHQMIHVDIDEGAEKIMDLTKEIEEIKDIKGEPGTNVGGMLNRMKEDLAHLTDRPMEEICIKDILAVDTLVSNPVEGGLAGEVSLEKAVAIAAMVKAEQLPMEKIAKKLEEEVKVKVKVAGVEAVMATLGAMTTPGTKLPLAILDLGGGSTDAALIDEDGWVRSVHLAGAGGFITMLMASELGIEDRTLVEEIKKYPVAKVESLFHIRMENGEVIFYKEPLNPKYFGKVVVLTDKEMLPIEKNIAMEKIVEIRRQVKKKVFVTNAIRALKKIAPFSNIKNIPNVVLVGGSALDFEIPDLILEELSKIGIIVGRGNIRRIEGPRNAVATGLVMSYGGLVK
ncbi:MAG: diol dehydratase reactivase subunit alpha [Epulopiscium sp.]|nr:diol dehydratase reactivase subunit alpha [Candidatus Epulonipiscium sp.]